jgi:hypothetical protein
VFRVLIVLGLAARDVAPHCYCDNVIRPFVFPDAWWTRRTWAREGPWGRVDRPVARTTARLARWGRPKNHFLWEFPPVPPLSTSPPLGTRGGSRIGSQCVPPVHSQRRCRPPSSH